MPSGIKNKEGVRKEKNTISSEMTTALSFHYKKQHKSCAPLEPFLTDNLVLSNCFQRFLPTVDLAREMIDMGMLAILPTEK